MGEGLERQSGAALKRSTSLPMPGDEVARVVGFQASYFAIRSLWWL